MGVKIHKQNQQHHPATAKANEQMGTKRSHTFIQAYRAWIPKLFVLYIIVISYVSMHIYQDVDAANKLRRKELLSSMCDQRARMLQDQFAVSVNHVHALAILVSTFHYLKKPSAIDQVYSSFYLIGFCCWDLFRLCLVDDKISESKEILINFKIERENEF